MKRKKNTPNRAYVLDIAQLAGIGIDLEQFSC